MEKLNIANRKFKLWFYQVSHSEAIIRSPKTDLNKIYDTNIPSPISGSNTAEPEETVALETARDQSIPLALLSR